MSSVVVVDNMKTERPGEATKARYLERVKDLDLEDLACRQELAETLWLKILLHEDLSKHHCVDWLKAHETHFSRAKTLETADLTGILQKSIMGPVIYRPLKQLGGPALIVEPPRHRTSITRIRVAIPAQLRITEKPLEPKSIGIPDTGNMGSKLAEDPKHRISCNSSQLAKTLAVHDRSDPGAARAVIVAGSHYEGTSPKLFWPETLVYLLPGAELNQMLTLVVALKSETPCETELLLFAGMNDHLYAAGFLEHLTSGEPTTPQETLGSNPDAVCTNERGAGVGNFSIRAKDESGVHVIARLREHATSLTVRVCSVVSDSGGQRVADAYGCFESQIGASKFEIS